VVLDHKEKIIMAKAEVRCPNCGTSFMVGNGGSPVTELTSGIHYLVPETVRNENKTESRMNAFKEAGIDISKLQALMQSNAEVKSIFKDENDPILTEISKGGFIRNPELFRRWITAQTFALLKDCKGWTHAVRNRFNTRYVFRQTREELFLQIKLQKKGIKNDKRFTFFTLDSMKRIFEELAGLNNYFNYDKAKEVQNKIRSVDTLEELVRVVQSYDWYFSCHCNFFPRSWLNSYKGAGAYYTLQNIIRTHGMILPGCNDMAESLTKVEKIYKEILEYIPSARRWDILMSVLTVAVTKTKFELKY
jgi:hypothetical protein